MTLPLPKQIQNLFKQELYDCYPTYKLPFDRHFPLLMLDDGRMPKCRDIKESKSHVKCIRSHQGRAMVIINEAIFVIGVKGDICYFRVRDSISTLLKTHKIKIQAELHSSTPFPQPQANTATSNTFPIAEEINKVKIWLYFGQKKQQCPWQVKVIREGFQYLQLQSKLRCLDYYLFYSQMSDKGRKKRLRNLVKRGYDAETQLLYLPSEELQSQDLRFIVEELKQMRLITLKICIKFQEAANNPIGVAGSTILACSPWKNLTRLEMKSTKIGPKGAKEIVKGDFSQLRHLRIGFNQLGNEGVKHLSLGRWKDLQELWLQGNHIGVDGCHWLSFANWKQLQHLSLWDNKIEIECSKKLIRLSSLVLSKLDLTFCNIKGCMNKHIQKFLKLKFVSLSIME